MYDWEELMIGSLSNRTPWWAFKGQRDPVSVTFNGQSFPSAGAEPWSSQSGNAGAQTGVASDEKNVLIWIFCCSKSSVRTEKRTREECHQGYGWYGLWSIGRSRGCSTQRFMVAGIFCIICCWEPPYISHVLFPRGFCWCVCWLLLPLGTKCDCTFSLDTR